MTKSLFEVPFTITMTGTRLLYADSPIAALSDTEATIVVDETNLEDSNLFWDAGTVCLTAFDFKVSCGEATSSNENPADHFLDPPEDTSEDEDEIEGETDTTPPAHPKGTAS